MYASSIQTIGIDCRFASLPVGIGRYTRELVAALAKRNDPWSYVLFVRSKDEEWIPTHERISVSEFPYAHYSFAEQFLFPIILKRAKIDLLFAPQFNVPLRCPVPFVATVHDLILHKFPNQASFIKRIAYRLLLRHAVTHSKNILTVSNATKKDLTETFGETIASKIHVAYPGVPPIFMIPSPEDVARVKTAYQLPPHYFFTIGNAKQHKNVQLLIDSFERANINAALVLVLFGSEADALRLNDKCIRLKNVPDRDLSALYNGAEGFVSATKYEGFGLPFIEAMASGAPVLGSDIPVLREICGGHATLVPPTIEALTLGLHALTKNPVKIAAAREYTTSFTWKKTADEVASVLGSALGY